MSMGDAARWLGREMMSDDERRHALSHELGLPFVELNPADVSVDALMLIPEPLAREVSAVAYSQGERGVEVAVLDLSALEHLEFLRSRYRLLPRLTSRESMVRALLRYQRHLRERYGAALERADSPNLAEALLRHALAAGASAVHLQTADDGLLVRYRVHGVLRAAMTLPPRTGERLVSALRSLAKFPQGAGVREARVRVDLGEPAAVRITSMPALGGDTLVLHLAQDSARRLWTLESVGLHGEALEHLQHALLKRRGLILAAGLPQSGRTTLLYTLLDLLNAPELSVATVEAEVAHALPRVSQVSPAAAGLSMAAAARGALKQDPDVLMIDPLEGAEALALAASAAARGILVLGAVALSDADVASAVTVRTALVRKLCTKHFLDKKKLTRAEQDALEAAGADFAKVLSALKEEGRVQKDTPWKDLAFPQAAGCSECEGGYQGVLGIQEVRAEGRVAGPNLIEDVLFKAASGLTSVDEVLSLTAGS